MATLTAQDSRWRTLLGAPHRLGFCLGAAQLVFVMLFWLAELAGRAGIILDAPLPLSIASPWAHALLMLYTLFTPFIYGFLFTVFPRWLGVAPIRLSHYGSVLLLSAVGTLLIYAGLFSHPFVLAIGLSFYLAGWVFAIAALIFAYRGGKNHGWHERLLLVELGIGAAGLALFLVGVLVNNANAIIMARDIGLWGFLVPVLVTVAHRIIPFFTQSAIPFTTVPRPAWSLPVFVGGSWLHLLFDFVAWPSLRLVVDLLLAIVVFHHSWQWGLVRSFRIRLLAMLHIAFLWFGIAMALYAIDAALGLLQLDQLGRAPLHSLGIGFITGVLVAMATRVTLGHSGRPLVPDAWTWNWFIVLNFVAVTRMAAEFMPTPGAYLALNLFAVIGWLVCLSPWVTHYAPIYWRPRVDTPPAPATVSPPRKS